MQKIATRVFIWSSVVFGILGLILVISLPGPHGTSSDFSFVISRLLMATVFVILTSFALSVASKYLGDGKK